MFFTHLQPQCFNILPVLAISTIYSFTNNVFNAKAVKEDY